MPASTCLRTTSPTVRASIASSIAFPVAKYPTLRDAAAQSALREAGLDVLVVAAYGLLLPPEILQIPKRGCINIHASLLPRWRGAAPIQRALLAGDTRTGVSIMQMDAGLDTGPVLLEEAIDIGPEDTTGSLTEALARLGLLDRFNAFPDGLDTEVRERGSRLSAGERQLVSIARAALADPSVLVLDEATSNLDLKSETRIERALDVLLEGRTAIIIAHRLATAMRADRIAVVHDGRIVEIGTHDELVANGDRYAELFATWSAHAA